MDIDEAFASFKDIVIDQMSVIALAEEEPGLLSQEQRSERVKSQVKDEIDHVLQEILQGVYLILQNLRKVPEEYLTTEVLLNIEGIIEELENCDEGVLKELASDFVEGIPLRIPLGIENKTEECLYQVAKSFYIDENYTDAASAFSFMTAVDPMNFLYRQAIGNCFYFSQKYEEAIVLYEVASIMDPLNPLPHLFSAYCAQALSRKEDVERSCEKALFLSEKSTEWQEIKRAVQDILGAYHG